MKTVLVLFSTVILLAACNKSDSKDAMTAGKATMSVYLTDGPGPYDAVKIDLRSIEVNSDSSDNGWKQLDVIHPGVYNLFRLRNGLDTLIASGELPAGKISQIRLILGPNNSVVLDGVSYPLETPSAQQSGIKLNINAELTAGVDYKIWTDFDGNRSIVRTGNNKFILKPVIRIYTKAVSGSVKGIVLPLDAKPWVYAIHGTDTVASAQPDSTNGNFLINGLSAGAYSIAIDGNDNYNDTTYNDVNVTTGSVTDVGTVQLHQ
jgi:hypothetical protein